MRTATAVLVGLCLAAAGHAADEYEIEVYPCPRAQEAMSVDGALDEAAWQRAPRVDEFTYYDHPEAVEPQTHLRVVYDDEALYLGVVCDEPRMEDLTPVSQVRDAHEVFHGETIEVFIDPDHDQAQYYQFGINAAGSIYDSRGKDPSWNADVSARTTLADDGWTLEMAVPWEDLGATPEQGMVVGLNVCRDRYLGANRQWSNWSQTAANFHDPERFGHIVLSPSPAMVGGLEQQLRLGGRMGAVVIHGPESFAQAAYRAMVLDAAERAGGLLDELAETAAEEDDQATREELSRRIEAYRGEVADFRATAAGDEAVGRERWASMMLRLGQLRGELERVTWEARLTALLSGI